MPKGYHHVTRDQRCQIYALKSIGLTQASIAKQLCVDASTISREIRRNSGQRGYRHSQADSKATQRRSQASKQVKKFTPALKDKVSLKLADGWSPEQIAGRFKQAGMTISHESIYR